MAVADHLTSSQEWLSGFHVTAGLPTPSPPHFPWAQFDPVGDIGDPYGRPADCCRIRESWHVSLIYADDADSSVCLFLISCLVDYLQPRSQDSLLPALRSMGRVGENPGNEVGVSSV